MKGRFKPRHIILMGAGPRPASKTCTSSSQKAISTRSNRWPIITKSLLTAFRDGILVRFRPASPARSSRPWPTARAALEQRRLAEFYDYLEIQPICNKHVHAETGNPRRRRGLRSCAASTGASSELGRELGKARRRHMRRAFSGPPTRRFSAAYSCFSKGFEDADRGPAALFSQPPTRCWRNSPISGKRRLTRSS